WTYQSCYTDSSTRTLPGANLMSASMTLQVCADFCLAGGWLYMGVENANECWCANGPLSDSLLADPATCDIACAADPASVCGGGWRLSVWKREAPIAAIQQVPGWSFDSCYTDDWERTLAVTEPASSTAMTPAACAALCTGYRFFGVENGSECYCGDNIDPARLAADQTTCSIPCTGQANFVCGGGWRLSVYRRTPPPAEQVPGWANTSCVVDSETRTLSGASFAEADMTASRCASLCCGWRYFGLENGNQCFCGNDVAAGLDAPLADCDVPCAGNAAHACG
ncbi:WSC domain-containing protein, partial [Stachybotrys elegans]